MLKYRDLPKHLQKRINQHPEIKMRSNQHKMKNPADNFKMQKMLFSSLHEIYGDRVQAELENQIPGRNFRIDIAIPSIKLSIEVLGWQFHGKYLAGFKDTFSRHNIFILYGWDIYYVAAGDIAKNLEKVIDDLALFLQYKYNFSF